MQVLILAGGLGTRLRPITETIPKCLVPVAGKPFLEHLISKMAGSGIQDFVIAVGYLAEQIQDYFKDGSQWNVRIRYSVENPPRGTGGALDQAKGFLADEFLFLNGDNLVHLDYSKLIKHFLAHPSWVGAMAIFDDHETKFRKNVSWDPNTDEIQQYDYNDATGKNCVDAGVKIFRKTILNYLPSKQKFSLEEEVLPQLACEGKLGAFHINSAPIDVGNPKQVEEAEKALK